VEETGAGVDWLAQAGPVLRPVLVSGRRVAESLSRNTVALLAAADELEAATRQATRWVARVICPDMRLEGEVATILNTCARMVEIAHEAIPGSTPDIGFAVDRIRDLVDIVDYHSETLGTL
jgi:hypothetical protein